MNKRENNVFLNLTDHAVSGENFCLIYNKDLDLLETSPQPSEDKLGLYYKSEDYISHTDSKRNAFEKTYHFVKTIALKRKLKLVNSINRDTETVGITEEKKILDIGCGTGDFLKVAQDDQWEIVGIEPNDQARAIANKKCGKAAFDLSHLSTLDSHSFDVITLWHVLEHLPNLDKHIRIFESLLKSDGRLIIAVPNYKSLDANYYKKFWAAFDVPRHLWHFSQTSISRIVAKKNMEVERSVPMFFDAYYVSLLSEKYKTGFMNPFRAFLMGWKSNRDAKQSGEYSSIIYVIKKLKNEL